MKKILLVFLCSTLAVLATACGNGLDCKPTTIINSTSVGATMQSTNIEDEEQVTSYSRPLFGQFYNRKQAGNHNFKEEILSYKTIHVAYPQLVSTKDENKQKIINNFITAFVMNKIVEDLLLYEEDFVDINYRIALNTPELISIVFEGETKRGGGAPTSIGYGLTFDINTLQTFALYDFVVVDKKFVEKVWKSNLVYDEKGVLVQEIIRGPWGEKEFFMEQFNSFNHMPYFYITPNSIFVFQFEQSNHYVWVEVKD
jgi:hypothetical protein